MLRGWIIGSNPFYMWEGVWTMSLRTNATGALDNAFDALADSITYAGNTITGVIDFGSDKDQDEEELYHTAILEIKVSDRSSVQADVDSRVTVVIDSQNWTVIKIHSTDWYSHRLRIQRDQRPVL